jgi:tRNA (guanine37-N1)-methyltransferase
VASVIRAGESVYDLCCGVGPFSLTIARAGAAREVVAVDLNPAAIDLLRRNAERLGLAGKIRALNAPIEAFLPTAPAADRVVLNLPHEGIKYVPSVGERVATGGTLHYYEVTEKPMVERRADALAHLLGERSGSWQPVEQHVVHPYAPSSDLVAFTLRRTGA